MDWKKLAPWNWFRHEEPAAIPDPRRSASAGADVDVWPIPGQDWERALQSLFVRFPGWGDALGPRPGVDPLRPSLDIAESEKAYTVEAELPGVEPDDVCVEASGDTLWIRAEKRREKESEERGYHCVERSYGAVQRILSLPEDADASAIAARFRHGVLELRIPKTGSSARRSYTVPVEAVS